MMSTPREATKDMHRSKEPIAIIGSACRLPGGANSPSKLWDILSRPRDVLSSFPKDRLNLSRFHSLNGEYHGSTDVENKSYLLSEDPRFFDAAFFNINPLEADGLDPQQRLLLEVVYEAIESAGSTMEMMQGSQTSVYVGSMTADYTDIQMRDTETMPRYAVTGTARSLLSNRVSYFFDLNGESMTIDTACSSSLVALHQAVQSLRDGHSTQAIVAGVNLIFDPTMFIGESNLHMLSPDARSRMWDKSANGYARGEGVTAIFLKPLRLALEDGDDIECIVRETSVNSDGRTKGITMPNATAQADLIRQTYHKAGLDPCVDRPQFFECHGTGTAAGDPQEARAIQEAFFPRDIEHGAHKLLLGSIKTVLGHTEGCAGLAGVLKASLAMRHQLIPPNMLFEDLNPAVTPFYNNLQLVTKLMPWPKFTGTVLRTSVNSFGFGGTNAHAILESYKPSDDEASQKMLLKEPVTDKEFIGPLTLSAKTQSSLLALVKEFTTFLKVHPAANLDDLTWMLGTRRTSYPIKTSFSGATRQRLVSFMEKEIDNAKASGDYGVQVHPMNAYEIPGILGIFTGQGAQWAEMAKQLALQCRVFRESLENCEKSLAALPDGPPWSLIGELLADRESSRMSEAAISQPLCTAVQVAMVDLVRAAGIRLDAVVGHSSGEIAATYAAGIISLDDAIRIAYYRGYYAKLARGSSGKLGAMMAVGLGFGGAQAFCAQVQFAGRICVAASNAPTIVTLSGDMDAIHEAKELLDGEKTFARLLNVDTAYHSHHMLPCSTPYLESLKACRITVKPPRSGCTWISSVRGDIELLESGNLETLQDQYWVDNMVSPVLFSQALECSLWNGGPFDMILELGPHPALKGPAVQTIKAATGTSPPYIGAMRRGDDNVEAFSGAIGYIWSHLGPHFVDLDGYSTAYKARATSRPKILKDLPTYPWDHQKLHWRESRISKNFRLRNDHPHELLGRRVPDDSEDEMRWRNVLRLNELPWLRGHEFQQQVLFPAAGYIAMAMEAMRIFAKDRHIKLLEIRDIAFLRALVIPESQAGVETVFSLRVRSNVADRYGKTVAHVEFSCYACSEESIGALEKRCHGEALIHFGQPAMNSLPHRSSAQSGGALMDTNRFFASLLDIGLNYQGIFRGIKSAYRKLGYATTSASWPQTEIGEHYMMHPAFLDSAFHAMFAAFASPASGALWTPYLPVQIRRLTINPVTRYDLDHEQTGFEAEAFVTNSSAIFIEGDLNVFDSRGETGVQVEGLAMKSFSEPQASNDRLLFAETSWGVDPVCGLTSAFEGQRNVEEMDLVNAIERTALHYFQRILAAFEPREVTQLQWYHQRLVEAVNTMLTLVRKGEHPAVRKEWLEDSQEAILSLKDQFVGQIDLEIMNAIGQNLESVLRGKTQLLEVMLAGDMLNRLYMEGSGFKFLNICVAKAIKQIAFKQPHCRILEIGAGTGGTTSSILEDIEDAYSAYTYTDISSGFFEKAADKFASNRGKMAFKILDIEKDPVEQGFQESSYDIVVASNVLHATRKLSDTVRHTRSLLKPGGYLILVEVTGDLLRMPFLMGGLPGWWLGVDEGRKLGPGISPLEWDDLLQRSGFSGVDNIVHDMPDSIKHSCSVLVSQAIDEKFSLLRDPLSSMDMMPRPGKVLIIGGKTLPIARMIRLIEKQLYAWKDRVTVISCLDDLTQRHLGPQLSVICLTELDKPIFSDHMTASRIALLQNLFSQSSCILWLTAGRSAASPLSNMMVGIGRALLTELPHISLQFVDASSSATLDPKSVLEAFLRLYLAGTAEYAEYIALWTTEPELVFDSDKILIPRITMDKTRNDRLNCVRRRITQEVDTNKAIVELVPVDYHHDLRLVVGPSHAPNLSGPTIQTRYSTRLASGKGKAFFLCIGIIHGSKDTALFISAQLASSVAVLPEHYIILSSSEADNPGILVAVASYLIADLYVPSASTDDGAIIVYEPEEGLAEAITQNTKWRSRHVIFVSSRRQQLPEGWIMLHPQSSQRAIERNFPSKIDYVLDFSENEHDKNRDFLLQRYGVCSMEPVFHMSGVLPNTLNKAFEETITNGEWRHRNQSLPPVTIAVQDMVGATAHNLGAYPQVMEWSQSKTLTVAVRPIDASQLFRSTKTYFLIGLTGELGQSLCNWMVRNGARYVALGSRNANPDSAWLEEIRSLGATIRVYRMDVSDREAVRSAYRAIEDDMPPIVGVCNAAMILSDKLFVDMTANTMNKVLEPKVQGTKHLDELFDRPTLDFFITFSSLASVIGNGGQSNYHAANLFMSSLAAQRRKRGLAASVINIGMVADVGYVARTGRSIEDHLRKLFYMPLSESDIHQLFAEAVLASPCDAERTFDIIMGIEPFVNSVNAQTRPPWFSNPRFSHFVLEDNGPSDQQERNSSFANIRQELETAESDEDATTMIQAAFSSKLENMMQLTAGSVNTAIPLLDLGCDSLLAVEIRTWFLKEVQVDIPVLKVLSGDSVAEICNEAARKYLTSKPVISAKAVDSNSGSLEKDLVKSASAQITISTPFTSSNSATDNDDSSQSSDSAQGLGSVDTSLLPSPSIQPQKEQTAGLDMHNVDLAVFERVGKMSNAQSRIWFLRSLLEDRTAYNITVSYKVSGELHVARLKRALEIISSRHESLRTCFFAHQDTGGLMQGVMPTSKISLKHLDSGDDMDAKEELTKLHRTEWGLEQGHTFQATLISHSSTEHSILFGYHHIILDGVSWGIFLRDLNIAYKMMPMNAPSKQYLDFVIHLDHLMEEGKLNGQVDYWEREHNPPVETLPLLPFARVKRRFDSNNHDVYTSREQISALLLAKLKQAAQALRITPFHFHLTVIQVLLAKLLDVEDLCIGITDASRSNAEFSDTVGFFLNLLPLRFKVKQQSEFSDLAIKTSKRIHEALANSLIPFDLILDRLNLHRSTSHSPLFQVAVNYRMGDMMQTQLGDLHMKLDTYRDAKSPYDLVFNITQNSGGLCLIDITCRESLYGSEAPGLLMSSYLGLLDHLSTQKSSKVQDCVLYEINDAKEAIRLGRGSRDKFGWPSTLIEKFDTIQAKYPNETAVKDSLEQSTYADLARRVQGIAELIRARGLVPGSRVAVLCQASTDSVACMLAILKMGCVFVPLDLSLPFTRHADILADAQPALMLCHPPTFQVASELTNSRMPLETVSSNIKFNDREIGNLANAENAAFLLYTSGSTGVPKGILLSHTGFINYVASKSSILSLQRETVLQQSSLGFDMSLAQIFMCLTNGGTLVIAPQDIRGDPVEIAKLMLKEKVSFTIATPSEYLMLLRYGRDSLKQYSTWRHACLGGEAITEPLKREFARLESSKVTLADCYGPTEISACTTLETVSLTSTDSSSSDIYGSVGKAIPNTSIYILDEDNNPLPLGFPGEICIGGVGVALGYFGLPELNQSKFLRDPFATAEDIASGWTTMYKTGDRGKLAEDGALIFMGRKHDSAQVKLRGLRIELEEVASVLVQSSQGALSDAVVSVRGEPEFLVAHVVLTPGSTLNDDEIQQLVRDLPLPQYMHPAIVIPLERLPTSSNGKLDRRALSALPLPAQKLRYDSQSPQSLTLIEGQLKLIWENVLPATRTVPLTPSSDFFMVGGNSLSLVKTQAAIKESFSIAVPLKDLYQASTLGSMAARITAETARIPQQRLIDWQAEITVPESMFSAVKPSHSVKSFQDHDVEVLMTGANSFLGANILSALVADRRVRLIYCIGVAADQQKHLPQGKKIKSYSGSLLSPSLGLSTQELTTLESSIDVIIHAGAAGHCLNSYSSLRGPNLHSTHFLAQMAHKQSIPLHYLSSNRVALLSGSTTLPPVSVAAHPPARDGSEGFTASKWASEAFLEQVAAKTGSLMACVHRPCAVVGDSAPSEDALNALLRYSRLLRAVPRFRNFDGFFDFADVSAVAAELVQNVLDGQSAPGAPPASTSALSPLSSSSTLPGITFRHYTGGIRTPVADFRLRMEHTYGGTFAEWDMPEWIAKAREAGIEDLIVTYLEAIVDRGETISFPYMGETAVRT